MPRKPKQEPEVYGEVKRSRTGNNPCQCLVPADDILIDDEGGSRQAFDMGCGAFCANRFAQGHDAKLKSTLIHAYRAGVNEMVIQMGEHGSLVYTTPLALADQLGWLHFMTLGKPVKTRTNGKASQPKDEMLVRDNVGEELHVGDRVEFKYRGKQTQATIDKMDVTGKLELYWETPQGDGRTHSTTADKVVGI